MELELAGKRVVVTGSSRGIGFAGAQRFAAQGCHIDLVARDHDALDTAVHQSFPDLKVYVYCNTNYSHNYIEAFKQIDDLDLEMIEQSPRYDDLTAHAKLQKELERLICLDQSIVSVERAPKPSRWRCVAESA